MTPAHHAAERRFAVTQADGEAFLAYDADNTSATITHTFVPPEWRGRGVAEQLVRAFIDWARSEHRRIESRCGYATAFLARHPELLPPLKA
jgi:predicted GNAT family acetyltransferase